MEVGYEESPEKDQSYNQQNEEVEINLSADLGS